MYGQTLETKKFESSLESVEGIGAHTQHAVIWYITLISLGAVSFIIGYILHLIPARSAAGRDCFQFSTSGRCLRWSDETVSMNVIGHSDSFPASNWSKSRHVTDADKVSDCLKLLELRLSFIVTNIPPLSSPLRPGLELRTEGFVEF